MDRLRTFVRLCSGLGLLVAGWVGCARVPGVEVPYVQTPSEVVMEMLRLARVTPEDVVDADISEATVVTMYLSPSVNARLRPKLQSQLRPGARIVSHDFPIGDWPPDRTVQFKGPERTHALSLWTIRAR